MKTARRLSLAACLILGVFVSFRSNADGNERNPRLGSFMLRDAPIEYAMSMLGEAWGRHIVVTDHAKKVRVRTFLKDIDCLGALKAVCLGHGLWYREDPSGIIYVQTAEEFARVGTLAEKKFIEVVTLAYPRAEDIAAAIQEAYRDLVVYTAPDMDDDDEIGDISRALDRMDQLQDRSSVLEGESGQSGGHSSSGRGRSSSRRSNDTMRGMEGMRRYADEMRRVAMGVEMAPAKRPEGESTEAGTLAADAARGAPAETEPALVRPSVVFVSIVRRSNSVVLRSSDRELLQQMKDTITKLDVPKAQVLLEVRILRLDVTDEKDRDIGFILNGDSHTYGNAQAGFMDNLMETPFAYKTEYKDVPYRGGTMSGTKQNTIIGDLGTAGAAAMSGHSVFQLLNNHYQIRLNLLDGKGKVRSLATPSLLVADYEASRVFIGKELSVLTDVEETQSVAGGNNAVVTTTVNPTVQRRDVGMALVITPKIHADGTVTLRVMQESASADEDNEKTIDYGGGRSFKTIPVHKQIITSSVVAKDGETIALGGLMQHEETDTLYKIPLLGDIPYLGALFRHKAHGARDYELMVLIRPSIIMAPNGVSAASRSFILDNMQDKVNLREAIEISRTNRAARAERVLAEPDSKESADKANAADADFEWMPGFSRGGKDAE